MCGLREEEDERKWVSWEGRGGWREWWSVERLVEEWLWKNFKWNPTYAFRHYRAAAEALSLPRQRCLWLGGFGFFDSRAAAEIIWLPRQNPLWLCERCCWTRLPRQSSEACRGTGANLFSFLKYNTCAAAVIFELSRQRALCLADLISGNLCRGRGFIPAAAESSLTCAPSIHGMAAAAEATFLPRQSKFSALKTTLATIIFSRFSRLKEMNTIN